jgi:hypothetical protein
MDSVKQTPLKKWEGCISMNENENLVTEVTENAEQTAEETQQNVKTYTQDELDAIVGKRLARQDAKIRKEYDRKYGRLEEVLKAGTGKEDVDEMTETFEKFYESKGVKINKRPTYSDKENEVLARAEAEDIIRNGDFEDVVDEVDRLAKIGVEKMTAREKAVFKILAEHRANAERYNALAEMGVTADEYNSPEFTEFANQFKSDVPITKVYEQYAKTKPKKEKQTTGSMKNSDSGDNGVKEFYTPEEAKRFTLAEIQKNPKLRGAIEKSMPKWK